MTPAHGVTRAPRLVTVRTGCYGQSVWRVVLLFACALVAADATGLLANCDQTCLDDTDGKSCPPACPTCSCAGHAVRIMIPHAEGVTGVAAGEARDLDMPAVATAHSRRAPAPLIRPPIA